MEPQLETNDLNNLVMTCLDYYKDGMYARDPDSSSQNRAHYNAKASCEKALKNLFTSPEHKLETKYISPLVSAFQEFAPHKVRELKHKNALLLKENYELKEKNKLLLNGHDRGHCGTCYYRVREAIDKGINQYVCEKEDVIALQRKLDTQRLKNKNYEESIMKLNNYQKNISDNYQLVPKDEWYEMIDKKAQSHLDSKNKKDTKSSNNYEKKYKKLKKENLKLRCKIMALEESGSGSGTESDCSDCSE